MLRSRKTVWWVLDFIRMASGHSFCHPATFGGVSKREATPGPENLRPHQNLFVPSLTSAPEYGVLCFTRPASRTRPPAREPDQDRCVRAPVPVAMSD